MSYIEGVLGNNLDITNDIDENSDVVCKSITAQSVTVGADNWATVVSNLNTSIASKSPKLTTSSVLSINSLTLSGDLTSGGSTLTNKLALKQNTIGNTTDLVVKSITAGTTNLMTSISSLNTSVTNLNTSVAGKQAKLDVTVSAQVKSLNVGEVTSADAGSISISNQLYIAGMNIKDIIDAKIAAIPFPESFNETLAQALIDSNLATFTTTVSSMFSSAMTSNTYMFRYESGVGTGGDNQNIVAGSSLEFSSQIYCIPNANAFSGNNYTCPVAGIYQFTVALFLVQVSASYSCAIFRSNVQVGAFKLDGMGSQTHTLCVDCAAGDVIAIKGLSGSGSFRKNLNSFFEGRLIYRTGGFNLA
jgi:hypothetical protein